MYMSGDKMYTREGGRMSTANVLRHKHVRIDQSKLDKAKKLLKLHTETEVLDRALELVVAEGKIDGVLKSWGGRGGFRKVFR
jgi:hypothetical protein